MTAPKAPRLDGRDAGEVRREILERLPAFVPGWSPAEGGAGAALLHVFSRYLQALIERLDQAPDKNKLAFLDLMGVDLVPDQAARAPVVFENLPNVGDSRVPRGARVGAPIEGRSDPLVFETEGAIALAAARLAEVVTLWPARDEYADHSADAARGEAFTLFEPRQRVPHILYLAHDTLFAFSEETRVELEFELSPPPREHTTGGSRLLPLEVVWEYWNGDDWQAFVSGPARDGTAGFTRSGAIRLITTGAQAARTSVGGIEACWIRGRLRDPLPPDPGRALPTVERIRCRTVLARALRYRTVGQQPRCVGDLVPDAAFGDTTRLDLTKAFYPLGRAPDGNSAFYLASEEVFAKAGAEAVVSFRRMRTPQEEADDIEDKLEEKVSTAAGWIVVAARQAAEMLVDAAASAVRLTDDGEQSPTHLQLQFFKNAAESLNDISGLDPLREQAQQLVSAIQQLIAADRVGDDDKETWVVERAHSAAEEAVASLNALSRILADLGPGAPPLGAPRLAWEYWNGKRWRSLMPISGDDRNNLLAAGSIKFTVPDDLAATQVNGVSARWVRARVAEGGYGRLRLVSWA